jgi:hypothetical protein
VSGKRSDLCVVQPCPCLCLHSSADVAYGATKGRGQRVEPPAGRVQHTHGLRGSYFPISLIYVQVPPELHEESTGS